MREYETHRLGTVMNMATLKEKDDRTKNRLKTPMDLEYERAKLILWIGVSAVCTFILIVDHVNPEIIDRILG